MFKDVEVTIYGGETVGIIGTNGCGKTTLLKILMGQEEVTSGQGAIGSWVKYAYLSQNLVFEDEHRTMVEEICAHRPEFDERAARDQLAGLQIYGNDVHKPISLLSGGERVRLYLCCAMLHHPDCLIMDEPTNHLDLQAREAIETALRKYRGTVIAISHDRFFLNRCVGRLLIFDGEEIRSFQGNYDAWHALETGNVPVAVQTQTMVKGNRKTPAKADEVKQTQERIRQLEQEIAWQEEVLQGVQAQFGPECPREVYEEYQAADGALQALYAEWERLHADGETDTSGMSGEHPFIE